MNIIPLSKQFRDENKQFTTMHREGDVILASYTFPSGHFGGWEVFQVRKYADKEFRFPDKENPGSDKVTFSPAHEAVPPASAWGMEGWSIAAVSGENKALEKFAQIAKIAKPSQILGIPTGKPRGRARDAFELNLSSLKDTFEFSNIKNLYPEVDEVMLRNRLKTLVDGGEVKVVGRVKGNRGKPRVQYQLI